MREVTVTYSIDADAEKRLEALVEAFNKKDGNLTVESLFRSLMLLGSTWDIKEKLAYAERSVDIQVGETYETRKER